MLGPAWFTYLNNSDVRFLFVLYPLFCILSLFTIEKFSNLFERKNIILGLIVIGILISSISFLEYKKIDQEIEQDAFIIAGIVSQKADGINSSTIISKYIKTAEINSKWPNLPELDSEGNISTDTKRISDKSFSTLEEFIKISKDKGLTHIVVDENSENEILQDVFLNSKKYLFLEEEYDSHDQNKKLWVKVFKINFDKFDMT